jgi:hypothetical protein
VKPKPGASYATTLAGKPKRYGNPGAVNHQPMPTSRYDAPVTVTLTGWAAQELRRVSRTQGAGTEKGLTLLATAAVMRGLPYVEMDLAPAKKTIRHFRVDTDDESEEDSP